MQKIRMKHSKSLTNFKLGNQIWCPRDHVRRVTMAQPPIRHSTGIPRAHPRRIELGRLPIGS
jgi:hypothetical protein